MRLRPFSPLSESDPLAGLGLEGEVRLTEGRLCFGFDLSGDFRALKLHAHQQGEPAPGSESARADELWKTTCFEAFIGRAGHPEYLEFNFAPSGKWNCYRFDRYREGMRRCEEIASVIPSGLADLQGSPKEHARIGWSVPWDRLSKALGGAAREELRIGITAVIEDVHGSVSYWAISHAGEKPDFHLALSFVGRVG